MNANEEIATCPKCGVNRKGKLGYCTQCEYVFQKDGAREKEEVRIKSIHSWLTWHFHLASHLVSLGFSASSFFFVISSVICSGAIHLLYPNKTDERLSASISIGVSIGIALGLIYLLFQVFDWSRKIVLIKERWTETRTTSDSEGNTKTWTVVILDTDQGMLEFCPEKCKNLKCGSSYFCWVGNYAFLPFFPKTLFLGAPFEEIHKES